MTEQEREQYRKQKEQQKLQSKLDSMSEAERQEYIKKRQAHEQLKSMTAEERVIEKKRRKHIYNVTFKEKMRLKLSPEEYTHWLANLTEKRKDRDKYKLHLKFLDAMARLKLPMFQLDEELSWQDKTKPLKDKPKVRRRSFGSFQELHR
jgi:hypothetical protein